MKKKVIFISIIFIMILMLLSVIIYHTNFSLQFEEVGCFDGKINSESNSVWFTLRDESYSGFYEETRLENLLKSENEFSNLDFKYDEYTYIITIGHELNKISYTFSQMKNRKLMIIPKQFVGIVDLKKESTEKIYIYKIKRMDIDSDVHSPMRGVSFS